MCNSFPNGMLLNGQETLVQPPPLPTITHINCSDAASILSTYANMIGLDFRYRILTDRAGDGFQLNYLQGIGSPMFTFSPFDSGRNYFRYHAIVNSRDVRTWDATLAVDGDGTSSSSPFVQQLVTGLDPMAYLAALSPEPSVIVTQMDDLRQIFNVDLMHDPGRRGHDFQALEGFLTPVQEFIPFAVAFKFVLGVEQNRVGRTEAVDLHRVVAALAGEPWFWPLPKDRPVESLFVNSSSRRPYSNT